MAKPNDRMLRADVLSDGRLQRVSRDARLLALVLECLADPTGCLRLDGAEVRASVGMFLADAGGLPPTPEEIETHIEELVGAVWLIEYHYAHDRLGYLKGFGDRQRGFNVCIGLSETGVIGEHLPLPPCAELERAIGKDKNGQAVELPKLLPKHCEKHVSRCPCERVTGDPKPSGPPPDKDPKPTRGGKGSEGKQGDSSVGDSESTKAQFRGGDAGEGADAHTFLQDEAIPDKERKEIEELIASLTGPEITAVMRDARSRHQNQNPNGSPLHEWVHLVASAAVEQKRPSDTDF